MSAETAEWLPIREVMNLTSKSERSVQRDAADLECKLGDPTNGRPGRLVKVSSLPSEIQLRWAAAERRKVVEIAPGNDAQMALALTAPMGPNLSVEDRAEMDERFRVIEPLVDREIGSRTSRAKTRRRSGPSTGGSRNGSRADCRRWYGGTGPTREPHAR